MSNLVLLLNPINFNSTMISTGAMKLRVSNISESGVHIKALEEPEWLVNLPELCSEGDGIRFLSKIGIDLQVTRVLKEVTVTGNVHLSIQTSCSRCVEPVRIELSPYVSLVLSPADKISDEDDDLEHETYRDDEIDLSNYLMEQIAISLPIKVVCNEDCKGLCTICGTNLNQETCTCESEKVNPKFAILKNLKI
ncbi:MAG: DUF177 domain-containing protein [Candidatus Dadabacteria bacterium]|nr:MAG: DUF177 domain-containing protein [Candidatus Dadabacteria bacterium]